MAVVSLCLIFLKDHTNSKGRDFPITPDAKNILVGVSWSDNAEHSDSPLTFSDGSAELGGGGGGKQTKNGEGRGRGRETNLHTVIFFYTQRAVQCVQR